MRLVRIDQRVDGPRTGIFWPSRAGGMLESVMGSGAVKIAFSVLAWVGERRERNGRRRRKIEEDW